MKQIAKRAMSFLLSFVMVLGMLPVMDQHHHAHAADTLTDTKIGVTFTDNSGALGTFEGSASGTTITATAEAQSQVFGANSGDGKITITNNRSFAIVLEFHYAITGDGSGKATGAISGSVGASGDYSATIAAGSSISISFGSGSASKNDTVVVTLTNVVAKGKITFGAADGNGSYTVNGATPPASSTDNCGTTYTLDATPGDGYALVGWFVGDSTTPVSTSDPFTYTNDGSCTIYPKFAMSIQIEFAKAEGNGTYTVNGEAPGVVTAQAGSQYTLTATPNSNANRFDYWYNATTGEQISTESTITLTAGAEITADCTIYPVFSDRNTYTISAEYDNTLGSVSGTGPCYDGYSATLTATPNSGVTFLGWTDGSGKILSTAASYTFTPVASTVVKAAFASASSEAWFKAGTLKHYQSDGFLGFGKYDYYVVESANYLFQGLDAAVTGAQAKGLDGIVLAFDGTLPADNYTIPSGVTLLIPYESTNRLAKELPEYDGAGGVPTAIESIYAYRTLTMASGANITVQSGGAISVNAKLFAAGGGDLGGGSPLGGYGYIKMQDNSNITVQNGGTLYCYGYIGGTGTVTANSGATLYEVFAIEDFRGGSVTTEMAKGDGTAYGIFPMNCYAVQNVLVPLTLEAGATEYAFACLYMSSQNVDTTVKFIGKSSDADAMFKLGSGSVTKKYDYQNDRMIVTANSGVLTLGNIRMTISSVTMDSKDYDLPIGSNFTIEIKSGSTIAVSQDISLLPGAEVYIEAGAACDLKSGYNMFIFDMDQWGAYVGSLSQKMYPTYFVPERQYTRTEANLKDAYFKVAGQVVAYGGAYTTGYLGNGELSGGASITGEEGAMITLMPGDPENANHYEMIQGGDFDSSTKTDVPLTMAKLQNADGTYTDLNQFNSTSGTVYTYTNGVWVPKCVTENGVSGCVTTKFYPCKDQVCTICDHVFQRATQEHIYGDAPTCTKTQNCTVCGTVLNGALGHAYTSTVVTAPTCTKEGYTTEICARCGDNHRVENSTVAATGHTEGAAVEENRVAATCIAEGGYDTVIYCSVSDCKAELSRVHTTLEKIDHAYNAGEVTKAATCTATGVRTYTCTVAGCGHFYTEDISALGHTPKKHEDGSEMKPSCVDPVLCRVCGQVAIAALGHNWGPEVEENRTEDGYYDLVKTCERCGEVSRVSVEPNGDRHIHIIVVEKKAPTCTEDGNTAGAYCEYPDKCAACEYGENPYSVGNEVIPALGHTLKGVTVTYTWNDDNTVCTASAACANKCGVVHSVTSVSVASEHFDATCEQKEYTVYTATFAENTGVNQTEKTVNGKAALGHHYSEPEYAWTEDLTSCTATIVCGRDASHSHTETVTVKAVVTAPTCETAGYTTYTADFQWEEWFTDQTKTGVPTEALGHIWLVHGEASWSEDFKTCTVNLVCDRNHNHTMQATSLNVETVYVMPTCTETGLYTHTATFAEDLGIGQQVKEITVKAREHFWIEEKYSYIWSEDKTTCTAQRTCGRSDCGFVESETVNATIEGNDASCTSAGKWTYTARFQNSAFAPQTIVENMKILGHEMTKTEAVEATCQLGGNLEYYTCSRCTLVFEDEQGTITTTVAARSFGKVNHKYVDYIYNNDATCEADGTRTAKCIYEGEGCSETSTKPALDTKLGHKYTGAVTTEPTCTEPGVRTYTCQNDNSHTYTEPVDALGHDYDLDDDGIDDGVVTTDSTCLGKGVLTFTCQHDETHTRTEEIDELGHTPAEAVKENNVDPDCLNNGSYDTVVYCARCGAELSRETIVVNKLGHEYESVVTDPTCTEYGYTTHTCTRCDADTDGHSYKDTKVNPLGHKDDENRDHVCENGCGVYQGEHSDAGLDHVCDYGCEEAIGKHDDSIEDEDHVCDYCGETMGDHEFVNGVCNCKYVQDINISLTIKATGSDDQQIVMEPIKYGSDFSKMLDFSAYGDCYHIEKVLVSIGGTASSNYGYTDDNILTIAGQYVTGDIEIIVTAAQNHKLADEYEEVETVYPTCTEAGYTVYKLFCLDCGNVIKQMTFPIKAYGHKYVGVDTAPTFDADGYTTYTCGNFGCDDTYTVVDEGSKLVVVAMIGETRYESVADAIADAKAGDTIVMMEPDSLEGTYDLSGITLEILDPGYAYGLTVSGNLTINGGTFLANGCFGIGVTATGTLTINGGSFVYAGTNDYLIGSYGTTVINGGSFSGQYCCVNGFEGTVIINGGDFTTTEFDWSGEYESDVVLGYVTVTGGTFSKDVTDYLAEGYCLKNVENAYVVGEHKGGEAVIENKVEADCENDGSYDTVVYCVHCAAVMSRENEVIPALGHDYDLDDDGIDDGVVTTAPTCVDKGVKTFTCQHDETHTRTEEIEELGHAPAEAVKENNVDPDCVNDGSYDTVVYCSRCNEELSRETTVVNKLGHKETWVETDPTCTEDGYITFTCERCGEERVVAGEAATGHIMSETSATAPGCESVGNNAYYNCGECGGVFKDAEGTMPTTAEEEKLAPAGHKYDDGVVTAPTCDDAGYTTYTCTVSGCGKSYKDDYVNALGHKYNSEVTTEPTCTETGVRTYTCQHDSSHTYTEEEPAKGHKAETVPGKLATCTETGLTAGEKCSDCGETLKAQGEIPAKGHKDDIVIPGKAASCTATGLTDGKQCSVCKEITVKQEEIPAKGHTPGDAVIEKVVAPTCTETGSHDEVVYCTICRAEVSRETVTDEATGHDYDAVDTAPTCEAEGYTTYICKNNKCNDQYKGDFVDALGHDVVIDEAVAPTCTAEGLTEGSHCGRCGDTILHQTPVPKASHALEQASHTPATCTEDGVTVYHCTNEGCDYEKTVDIEATGHTKMDVSELAPTCTAAGLTAGVKCSICGTDIVAQEVIPALGHTWESEVTDPTCTEQGFTFHKCSVCGDEKTDSYVAALGHTEKVLEAVAPTCTATGLTEGKECAVCGHKIKEQEVLETIPHTEEVILAVAPTCTEPGLTAGKKCSVCDKILVAPEEIAATGHIEVTVPAIAPECGKSGWTEGTKCSACGFTIKAAEEIPALEHIWDEGRITTLPTCTEKGVNTYTCKTCNTKKTEDVDALGHETVYHDAQHPTYYSVGWEAYETCKVCDHNTYKEIPALGEPSVGTYEEFMAGIKILEEYANAYVKANPGKDPMWLLIKYVRTGVDRYNSGSWNIMAGYEDAGFAEYVKKQEEAYNKSVDMDSMINVTGLKNIKNFTLPNGDKVDFGHMFGTMDISYHNNGSVNHADVAGWAGDLVDLLSTADRHGVVGTLDEMIEEISTTYLNHSIAGESDQFSHTDMYGDLDGFYMINELTGQEYENGLLYSIFSNYFVTSLTDEQRAAYFLTNRLNGVSSRGDIRDAVFNEYVGNSVIATLEGTREFTTQDLPELRRACCYAFADYLCQLAGDYVEINGNRYYEDFSAEKSTLAPGITQEVHAAYTADGKQIKYYLATADLNNQYVHVYANYHNADPTQGWEMSRVMDQANAAQDRYGDPSSPYYIPNYNVIASINAAGYDMTTGQPGGLLVMGGIEYNPVNGNGFFGILKDGTAMIGTTEEYLQLKEQGLVMEGVAGFGATLIKDGEIVVDHDDSYVNQRASRTAIGITKTGKVVFLVVDGRQEPVSCGGSMQELAQIMLEAGCVDAINLDGGGSSTFIAKQEGQDELSLVNVPSDGFQRSVGASLIMVSTAPSSTAFDHAVLESKFKYMTVGSSVQFYASGVSATGNTAELPEGTTWAVSDPEIASISEDGVLTALDNGEVTVMLMLGDQVIGSKAMYVVVPDAVYFTKEKLNAVHETPLPLPVAALYQGKPVAILESDVYFTLSNDSIASMNGWEFTAQETDIKKVTVTVHSVNNPDATSGSITLALYAKGEASFEFDKATGGDAQLAWIREVSNSTTMDNTTYFIVDKNASMVTSYTFGIDMTQIPMPEKLEDLVYMLPGADVDGNNSAWSFLLQLAERVSVLTEVKPVIRFDSNLIVDYSKLEILCDYFTLEDVEFIEETNELTLSLRWIDQTQSIDPDTANPICILSGIKLTPKDDAAWDAKDNLSVINSGTIGYDIYLRANALYSFSQKPENQEIYGLYPFENPNDPSERGGHFADTYKDFSDAYVLSKGQKTGWVYEDGGYAYYEGDERYYGVRKVGEFYYDFGETGINVGQTKYTGIFKIEGKNHYAKAGVLTSGWISVDGAKYCFDENGVGYHGAIVIDEIELIFDNGLLVGGQTGFVKKSDGNTYYYNNGEMVRGWLYIGEDLYHFNTDTGVMTTGTHVIPDAEAKAKGAYYDFAEDGKTLRGYFNGHGYYYWAGLPKIEQWVQTGADPDGWYRTNSHGHYVTDPSGNYTSKLKIDGVEYTVVKIIVDGVLYTFNNSNGKLLVGAVVTENDQKYYYWAGQAMTDGWFTIAGETYYAYSDGHLATGITTIDGKKYQFSSHGILRGELFTMTYNANGAEGTVPNVSEHVSGTELTIAEKGNLTLEGYMFKGWNTAADGSGATYQSGDIIALTGHVVLYAMWEKMFEASTLVVENDAVTGEPVLIWLAVEGAELYEIWRSTAADGEYKKIGTATEATYTDIAVEAGKTYYYKVRAMSSKVDGEYSEIVSCVCVPGTTTLTAERDEETIMPVLSWTDVMSAESYEIWRSEAADAVYEKIGTATELTYTDTTAEAGKVYYYKVRGVAGETCGKFSEVVSVICNPATPVMTAESDIETGKPVLVWLSAAGAEFYEIWRSGAEDGEYEKIGTATELTYTDATAEAGKTYYYKVCAVAGELKGEYSEIVSVTCTLAIPVLTAENDAETGKPVLNWLAVGGAESYEIWRSDAEDGGYEKIGTAAELTYTDATAEAGKTYYYKVRAVKGEMLGEYSKIVAVACVEVKEPLNGLNKDEDGVWRYYENGEIATDFSGFVKHINGKYYWVNEGVVKKSTGFVKHVNGKYYYIRNGVKHDITGFVKHTNGKYYYLKNGVKTDTTGFIKHINDKYYYVKNGMMMDITALVKHTNGKYYYVVNGVKQDNYTGMAQHSNGKYYYIVKGMMRDDYTGLAKHTDKQFYYVESGMWVQVTALVEHTNGKLYYVKDGIHDNTFNGKAKTLDGVEYEVVNGIAKP